MADARRDQAVTLLTGTSPAISLLLEREQEAAEGHPAGPSDSDPTGTHSQSGRPGQPCTDVYPVEVRLRGPQGRGAGSRLNLQLRRVSK